MYRFLLKHRERASALPGAVLGPATDTASPVNLRTPGVVTIFVSAWPTRHQHFPEGVSRHAGAPILSHARLVLSRLLVCLRLRAHFRHVDTKNAHVHSLVALSQRGDKKLWHLRIHQFVRGSKQFARVSNQTSVCDCVRTDQAYPTLPLPCSLPLLRLLSRHVASPRSLSVLTHASIESFGRRRVSAQFENVSNKGVRQE